MGDSNLPPIPPSASDLPESPEPVGPGHPPTATPDADATQWLLREADVALAALGQCTGPADAHLIRRALELLGRLRFELRQVDPDAGSNG